MFGGSFWYLRVGVSTIIIAAEENLLLFLLSRIFPGCGLCLVVSGEANFILFFCLFSFHKGTPLYAAHFRPGQYVDVTAKT